MMKRMVAFWVVAAGVGTAATITTLEQGDGDREAAQLVDRTPPAEPTAAADVALPAGGQGDNGAGAASDPATRRADRQAARRAKRQRAVTTAASSSSAGSATAVTTAPPAEPTTWTDAPGADASECPGTARGIVIDRRWQRAWMCAEGAVATVFPITSAASQPDPGTYPIYALDYQTSSNFGEAPSTLDRFVAFTYGKYEGARIGFHAVPYFADGSLAQPLDSVGDLERFGETSGCIRVLPDHAELIYGTMQVGDEVRVIS